MRHTTLPTLVVGLPLAAASTFAAAEEVVVGSTNFPEQLILANMYADVLSEHGVDVERRLNLGSREVVFPAIESGEIDVLPEYSGALLYHVAEDDDSATGEDAVLEALAEALPSELEVLEAASAQNKDTLVVRPETAEEHDLETFSDLAPVAGDMVVGGPSEMETRDVGLPGLEEVYDIEFATFRALDAGGPVTTGALENGDIDVARMFTTQGVIADKGWVALEDDKGLNPAQNLVPLVRSEAVSETVREALNAVSAELTTADLQSLNAEVSVDEREPEDVAREWLREQDLIDD